MRVYRLRLLERSICGAQMLGAGGRGTWRSVGTRSDRKLSTYALANVMALSSLNRSIFTIQGDTVEPLRWVKGESCHRSQIATNRETVPCLLVMHASLGPP